MLKYYNETVQETLKILKTPLTGLLDEDVNKRRHEYGTNELEYRKCKPLWLMFLLQSRKYGLCPKVVDGGKIEKMKVL